MPGQSDSTWARPMISAARIESASIDSPGWPGLNRGLRAKIRITTPPMTHATSTGHVPNRWSLMEWSKAAPMTAAGRNATTMLARMPRPCSSRPMSPSNRVPMRFRYSTRTARIAPSWMATA